MSQNDTDSSRAYPSREFFEDRLRVEVEKAAASVNSLEEALRQLRVIWAVPNREAVLTFIENLCERRKYRLPEGVQTQVAIALKQLVEATPGLPPGHRHSADQAVSRIISYLDPPLQLAVITPWFQDTRKFRVRTVMRTLRTLDDLSPHADYLVREYRTWQLTEILHLIARTPKAAQHITPEDLAEHFEAYTSHFVVTKGYRDKSAKYMAMIAARVLIVGDQTIPPELLRRYPEVFSWAIEEIGDPAYEPLLVFLIVEHRDSPELLWSAVRTAQRRHMPKALARGLEAARALLNIPESPDETLPTPIVQQRLPPL